MNHKYIVTGATGKIGTALMAKIGKDKCIGLTKHGFGENLLKIDLSNWNGKLEGGFNNFDTVVHLAAKAHIDDCEKDRQFGKKGETWKSNVVATENVVEFCRKTNKKLIYLSTECVFDGKKKKYTEEDVPHPINWYGVTKLKSEKTVLSLPDALIIRTVMAYDGKSKHRDIVKDFATKLLKGEKVFAATDQIVSFTHTDDIIQAIQISSLKQLSGIYHFVGPEAVSVYHLALEIAKLIGVDSEMVISLTMEEILGKERALLRLRNSVLDYTKFCKTSDFRGIGIKEGLRKSLNIDD